MSKCVYCGTEIRPGTGKMFVYNNGKVVYYCSNKCEKNQLKLGRVARNYKWTKFYAKGVK